MRKSKVKIALGAVGTIASAVGIPTGLVVKNKLTNDTNPDLSTLKDLLNEINDKITAKNTVEASAVHMGSTTAAALGITLAPPAGVTFAYEVIDNTGDGFSLVTITATKGSAMATKDIKVTGFESKTQADKTLVDHEMKLLSDKLTAKNTVEASTVPIGPATTTDLGIWLTPPTGVKYSYEVMGNTGDGFLNVKVTARRGSETATKDIKVIGFETKAQIKLHADLKVDQALIDSALKSLTDQTTSKTTMAPSTIPEGIIELAGLGISLIPPTGITYAYEVTDNRGDGFLSVKVLAAKGLATATKIIKVTGFESNAQVDQESANSIAKSLTDQTTSKNKAGAASLSIGSTTAAALGITLAPPAGVTFAYEVTDNTGDGILNVKVTVTKNSSSAIKNIQVTGFASKAQVDQALVDTAAQSLTNQITSKATAIPSTIPQSAATSTNLGISLVPPAGVTYTYEVTDNTGDGYLTVKVTATKGLATATRDIQVTGFETIAQVNQSLVDTAAKLLTDQTTSKNTVGASTVPVGSTTAIDLGITFVPPTGVTLAYEVTDNTGDGYLTVKVTAIKGLAITTKDIKVNGFETKAQADRILVDSAVKSLSDQTTSKTTVIPSTIPQSATTPSNLGIWLNPPTGVTYTYEVTDNTGDGFLNVRVTATKGLATATKDIKVTGFETTAQADQVLVNSLTKSLIDQTTSRATILPSAINKGKVTITDLGIILAPPAGIIFTYEVTDNTGDAFLNVKVTATKGSVTATKDIKVKGFLTALYKANEDTTKAANALTDAKTTLKDILTSTFHNGPTTQKALGISIAEQPGVSYKYKIVNITDGGIYIEVTLTSGSISKVKTIKVTGFETKAQADLKVDQVLVDATIKSLTDQITTENTIEAVSILQSATTSTNLGISLTPPAGVTYAYEVTDNTGDGFLNVRVTATKGFATATKDIKVTGFETKAKADQATVDSSIRSLTDQTTTKGIVEASTISQGTATNTDLGFSLTPLSGVTYTYEVTDNKGDGFLNVKVTATKGVAIATKDIKVRGFLTAIGKVNKADNTIVTNAINLLSDTTTSLNNILTSTFHNGPTTQKALGISIAEQPDVTYTYKVDSIVEGEIYIEVTLTKGSITKVKTVKVTGFETTAHVNQGLVDAAMKSLTDQTTTRTAIAPLLLPIGATVPNNLGISLTPPAGVTYSYEVTDNKGDGFLNVKVTVTKGSITATKDIKVTGFETQAQAQIKADQIVVDSIDQTLSDTTTSLNNILTSTFHNGPTTQKALGISIAEQPGVSYTYKVVGTADGEVSIAVTFAKGLAISTKDIKVTGFEVAIQAQLKSDQATVDSSIRSLTDQTTTKNTVGAFEVFKGTATNTDIGVTLTPPTGVTYAYEVTDNTHDGFLSVKVTATKGSATATKIIKVTGFVDNAQANQAAVNSLTTSLTDQVTTRKTVLSSAITRGAITSSNLGVTLTPPTGVTYAYEVTDNTRDGYLSVKVTITKGSATATKDIKVTGFLLKDDRDLVDKTIATLPGQMATSTHNVNAQTISVGKTTLAVLGITLTPPKGVAFSYAIVNIGNGFINVKVTVTRGSAISTKIIKVTGFAHHFSAQEAVDRLPGSQNWNQYWCSYSQVAGVLPAPLGVHFRYDISNFGTGECSGVYIYATDEQGVTRRSRWVDLY